MSAPRPRTTSRRCGPRPWRCPWTDEIRDPRQEVSDPPGRAEPASAEVKMAHQLIDALAIDWNPHDFHDAFQVKVKR